MMDLGKVKLLYMLISIAVVSGANHPQPQATARSTAPGAGSLLTSQDKALLQEALNLKEVFGDDVWPGFRAAAVPIILYNDHFEFLTGSVNPKRPPWVKAEDDVFSGRSYYRRPAINPQAFAVEVEGEWAGSMSTLDRMAARIPLKISPDYYVVLLLHEVFHAFQASQETARFRRATSLYLMEGNYPAKDPAFAEAWTEEGALLAAALKAKDRAAILAATGAFLKTRQARREPVSFSPGIIDYEREMEWLEGLAKYAEIRFYELAAARAQEPSLRAYKPGLPHWTWDFVRLEKQLGAQQGDLRFYLSGMAQARMLDRLSPAWKARFFRDGGAMEDRLQALVKER